MTTIIAKATHKTTCPYCGVGCGVDAITEQDQLLTVAGSENHPANFGRLCVKGSSLHETVSLKNRLLHPQVEGKTVSWDEALETAAEKFKSIIETDGPDAVAFYLSGQLLTEDYYIANKLMKGFIGTSNVDTNSRLCMASAVIAHKRAFGEDLVPGCYEDLENTDVLFLIGSNTAYAHPIVFQRIVKAKEHRDFKVVVIDPRRTATCDIADEHIALKPGTDAYFFNGLLVYLAEHHKMDSQFIQDHCLNFADTIKAAQDQTPTLEKVAEICDVNIKQLITVYQWFAENEKVVSLFSQGINQSSSGVDKGNSIINCHLATGKIGKSGSTPFSITGQPNAMGGREVGGLANQLAAHLGFESDDIKRVADFWQATNMTSQPGLKAVDLFNAIDEGKVKAVWIMATNPVVSMPEANKVKAALERCECVIVSDCNDDTDTAKLANILLPATAWAEKIGTVTNSERCISIQKGFLAPPGEALHDWEIMVKFAEKMGYSEYFSYEHPVEIFREHAALSGYENSSVTASISTSAITTATSKESHDKNIKRRAFDISHLKDISLDSYLNFTPTQWPITTSTPQGTKRLFSDNRFFTPSEKACFVPITAQLPQKLPQKDQLMMNTGRIRDQWHTMTRTGKAPRLLSHASEPFIQIHPEDATPRNIKENDLVVLKNNDSRYIGRVKITNDQRVGETFVPMHWNEAFASESRADALVNAYTDPLSGQPEYKHCPVDVEPLAISWQGAIISSQPLTLETQYWSKITISSGNLFYIGDSSEIATWITRLKSHFPAETQWVKLFDHNRHIYRLAGFVENQLLVALFIGKHFEDLPNHQWLGSQLPEEHEQATRFKLLAGVTEDESESPGAIICSCFQVGENTIKEAVHTGLHTAEALGEALKCGTNCGSCIPELKGIIETELS